MSIYILPLDFFGSRMACLETASQVTIELRTDSLQFNSSASPERKV